MLPAYSPAPADRGILFTGFLFLTLRAITLIPRQRTPIRSAAQPSPPPLPGSISSAAPPSHSSRNPAQAILSGLALYGLAAILSQAGRSLVASHHQAQAFALWSYTNALVWLAVLLFWIIRFAPAAAAAF